MNCGFLVVALHAALLAVQSADAPRNVRFEVSFASELRREPLTGRLLVVVAKNAEPEPRLQISPQGPALFAVDVEALAAGRSAVVDARAASYPMALDALPEGDYAVQVIVNVYEQVARADGRTLWLHMNDGRQEPFQVAAGNLYSDVRRAHLGGAHAPVDGAASGTNDGVVELQLTHVNAAAPPPADTEWVKHVAIGSPRLTAFWGRPIQVHATVLLPKGYADDPAVRYPCVYTFGHDVPFSFTTTDPGRAGRVDPARGVESGFEFQKAWISDDFPRLLAISFEQQTPFFPDSYSVNSDNDGPYGDAMVEEVIPELEKRFRLRAEPWARHVEGASTGGWQTLALELQHPDFFGGAWVLQPDPIDFHRYQLVDLYQDENAFEVKSGQFGAVERPFRRTVEGQEVWSVRQLSRFEAALGSHGRSGYQLEGWEAVFAPVGADGYPQPFWDKLTGKIDHAVVEAARARGFDLRDYAERRWHELGPKLAGKLHFFAGDMDDFFLNLAVYRFEEFLKSTTDPVSDAEFTYGRPKRGHGWHAWTWAEFVRHVAAAMERSAPGGRDGSSSDR